MRYNRVVRLLLLLLTFLTLVTPAWALDCGNPADLEMNAYRGKLSETDRACLETAIAGDDPVARSEASFILIVDAYVRGNGTEYGALMKRHLTQLHTTDAEVAYLYATWLWREGQNSDEVLHWARVAMDGRRRWLHNRANYDRMVKSLYDMMVQVSMERAIQVEQDYAAAPTATNRQRADAYKRQARYYLIIAAPCLHYGDCGPYFDVEVEGWAPCDDLVQMEAFAKRGQVTADHLACLKSKYRKPQAPKARILAIMSDQADTDGEGKAWEELMAWHWNLAGVDDPVLAYRYAEFLLSHGAEDTEEALKWAQVALSSEEGFSGRTGRSALARLHVLRVQTAQRLVEDAQAAYTKDPSAYNQKQVEVAQATLAKAERDRASYCQVNGCDDP